MLVLNKEYNPMRNYLFCEVIRQYDKDCRHIAYEKLNETIFRISDRIYIKYPNKDKAYIKDT